MFWWITGSTYNIWESVDELDFIISALYAKQIANSGNTYQQESILLSAMMRVGVAAGNRLVKKHEQVS